MISEILLEDVPQGSVPSRLFRPEIFQHNKALVRMLKVIADDKNTAVSKLALAKYPELSRDDIARVEIAFPSGAAKDVSMRNMRFIEGKAIIQGPPFNLAGKSMI